MAKGNVDAKNEGAALPLSVCLERGRGRSDAASALADPERRYRHGSQNHPITKASKHGAKLLQVGEPVSPSHPSNQPIKQLVPTTKIPSRCGARFSAYHEREPNSGDTVLSG